MLPFNLRCGTKCFTMSLRRGLVHIPPPPALKHFLEAAELLFSKLLLSPNNLNFKRH